MDYIELQDIKLLKTVMDFTRIFLAKKTKHLRTNVNDDNNPVHVL